MKKIILIAVSLVALAVALCATATYWLLQEPEPEWTSHSEEALKQLALGLENLSKFYSADAAEHLERAVELDSDLAMAKLHLIFLPGGSTYRPWLMELGEAELSGSTARERFLLTYWQARFKSGEADPEAILAAYLEQHPEDPYAIKVRCNEVWEKQQWDAAEECYGRLLELHPNWVEAQNRLGYVAMARGRFEESEERFRLYRYIAPDQANPHDSLAELLILLGRYEEAEEELRETVRIKSDFCHAYQQQVQIGLFTGRFDRVEQALRDLEAVEGCARWAESGFGCSIRATVRYFGGDPEGAWQSFEGPCLEQVRGSEMMAHRIAVFTGRLDRAAEMEEIVRQRWDAAVAEEQPVYADFHAALLFHMEGVRALEQGELAVAAEKLSEVDRLLGYWAGEQASFKLWNRLNLLHALEHGGHAARAEALRHKIRAINPRVLDELRLADLEALEAG